MNRERNGRTDLVIASISLTLNQRDGLREIAESQGTSVSAIVRDLIDVYLTKVLLNGTR